MIDMTLNPIHLRTLHEIARLGSFSRAAEALHLRQPAVSLHVRQLEESLGLPLLERTGKRATPTRAGTVLLEHGGRALDALDAAAARVHALRGVVAGSVRVGTGATASIYLLPPILRRLRARYPDLELVIVTGNTPEIAKAVAFREAQTPEWRAYQAQIIKNTKALAEAMLARGYRLVSGGTDTHLLLVDLTPKGITGKDAQEALDRAWITVNKKI